MGKIVEIVGWLIAASLAVLVVTHPNGFAKSVTAVGSNTTDVMKVLTGKDQPGQG